MISVVICTHNPKPAPLRETLEALTSQRDAGVSVEFIIVDNASAQSFADLVERYAPAGSRIVRETALGLTHARLRGLSESKGDIILFVDDDNVLAPGYLASVQRILAANPELGAIGGKSLARFSEQPPEWFTTQEFSLGCRDLGDEVMVESWKGVPDGERAFPLCAPIGAGMAIRRHPLEQYAKALSGNNERSGLDRRGQSLASGGDNDIALCTIQEGYAVGYFPELVLTHLIPSGRFTPEYLARYQHDSTKTWVAVLDLHGICPWSAVAPWTLPLRKARAYIQMKAWRSTLSYIRWKGACGLFEGRAALARRLS